MRLRTLSIQLGSTAWIRSEKRGRSLPKGERLKNNRGQALRQFTGQPKRRERRQYYLATSLIAGKTGAPKQRRQLKSFWITLLPKKRRCGPQNSNPSHLALSTQV